MKKYKLIKTYPGSPVLGFEIEKIGTSTYVGGSGNTFQIRKEYIEYHSEFWEKVVEKDYEILCIKHKESNHIWKNDSQLKNIFCIADGKAPFTSLEEINRYPKVYEIHSIKRLSDGEV